MNLRQAAQQALEALEGSRRSHHYCEDTWYSCPKHEGGCANEAEGDECNCGADKANEKIDQAITAIEQALAEPEQKPVAWYFNQGLKRGVSLKQESPEWMPLYTALRAALAKPEQEPVAWMDIDDNGQRLTVRQWSDGNKDEVPLYTAPTPRRPLTEDQIVDIWAGVSMGYDDEINIIELARALERAHGIGEQT